MRARIGVAGIALIAVGLGAYLTLMRRSTSVVDAAAQSSESLARADNTEDMPRFSADGSLLRPEGWEAWVMVGTSVGLTYDTPGAVAMGDEDIGMFLNVYMQPWAYHHFIDTGEFAEKTMFILAMSEPTRKADPARGGFYEGDRQLTEIHLKQDGLHESGWGFYAFSQGAESGNLLPGAAPCYSCHAEQTSFDNVFVQFYPQLRRVKQEGT